MLAGKLVTEGSDFNDIELLSSDLSDLNIHFSNTSDIDAFIAVKYTIKGGDSILLYGMLFPIRANDSFTAPFKITLKRDDVLSVKSDQDGINVSLIK